jgi:glycosyltransferase involved in cell wall biosynthesis
MAKRPLKLLCLIPNLNGGGAERVMLYLLQGLDRKGFDITFGVSKLEGEFADQIPSDVRTVNFGHERTFKVVPRLAQMLRKDKYDIAYSMTSMNMAVILARDLSRARLPLVLGARNHYTRSLAVESRHPRLFRNVIKTLYPRAEMVIGVAKGTCDDLVENFNVRPERARTILNPLDLQRIQRLAKEDPGHPWLAPGAERKTIVTVGKYMEAKGHFDLIEAFRKVKPETNARLMIVGQGPLKEQMERRIAELGMTDDVALVPFQKNPFAFMNRATVFVLSSHWEGFPNVLSEAMASGAPVVSTRCPSGPDEIIDDRVSGLLVPVAKPDVLASALTEILKDDNLRARLQQRSSKDVERFDLPNILGQYASAFEEVADRARN